MEKIRINSNEDSVPKNDVQDASSSSSVEVSSHKLSGQFVTNHNDVILKLLRSNVHELKEGKKISIKRSTISDLINKGLLVRVENKLCDLLNQPDSNSFSQKAEIPSSFLFGNNEVVNQGNSTEISNCTPLILPPDNGSSDQKTVEGENVSILKSPYCRKMVSKTSKNKSDAIKRLYLLRKTRSLILRKRSTACQNCTTCTKSSKFRKKIKSFHQKLSKKISPRIINSKETDLPSETTGQSSLGSVIHSEKVVKTNARKSLKNDQFSLERSNTNSFKKSTKKIKSVLLNQKLQADEKISESALQFSEIGKFCNEQSAVDLVPLSNEFIEEIENEVEVVTENAIKPVDTTVLGTGDKIINENYKGKTNTPENLVNEAESINTIFETLSETSFPLKVGNEQTPNSSFNGGESGCPKLYSLRECTVLLTRLEALPEFREIVMDFKNANFKVSRQISDIDMKENFQANSFNFQFLSNSLTDVPVKKDKKKQKSSEKLRKIKIKEIICPPKTQTNTISDNLNVMSLDPSNLHAEKFVKFDEQNEISSTNLESYIFNQDYLEQCAESFKEKTKKNKSNLKTEKSKKNSSPKRKKLNSSIEQKSSSNKKKKSPVKKKKQSTSKFSKKLIQGEGIELPVSVDTSSPLSANLLGDSNTIVAHKKLPDILTVEQQVQRKLNLVGIKLENLSDYLDISHFLSLKETKPNCLLAIKMCPTSVPGSGCQKFSFVVVELLDKD